MKTKLIASLIALAAVAATPAQAEVKVSTQGGLKVTTPTHSFQFGGRIMYDYNKAELNGVTDEDDLDLRRGRIYFKGDLSENWAFKTQFDTDGTRQDVYLRYKGWGKKATLTIGNQRIPVSLQAQTSSNDISVLERSALTELYDPGRRESVMLHGELSKQSTYAVALYADDTEDSEWGIGARYTNAPILTDTSVVHLGAWYNDIDERTAVGFEAAAVSGPFHIQAELVDGEQGTQDLSSAYVQLGYILTGETLPYKGGKFKRVTPGGDKAAWEIVARYEDGDGSFGDIELGTTDAKSWTLGLNYIPHKNIKIGVNYTDGESNLNDDEGNEFRIRFQATF